MMPHSAEIDQHDTEFTMAQLVAEAARKANQTSTGSIPILIIDGQGVDPDRIRSMADALLDDRRR